jgi:hypothetical protein
VLHAQANGHRVMVISPRYDQYKDAWDTSVVAEVRAACGHTPKTIYYIDAVTINLFLYSTVA